MHNWELTKLILAILLSLLAYITIPCFFLASFACSSSSACAQSPYSFCVTSSCFNLLCISAFKLRQELPVHPACFLPFPCDFLPATRDHFWGLRRLSCKIRLLPWVPWFFREVCHGDLACRSLNRPKICFSTVQDCNSAGSLALFAYSFLSSLRHLHCHQPLPPQLALCPPVGFASLLVKQENASPVGSLITCDVKLSSTHSVNLCTVQCCLQPEWHCLHVSGSEMWFSRFVSSFSPSHAPGCKNGFVWFEKDRYSEH